MRIDVIRIRNLASLAGTQQEICLTGGGMSDNGLLAITGQTGSGKSTVLDAVSLALYGQTPRLQGLSKLKDTEGLGEKDVGNLLNRDAVDGFAEVDFTSINGEQLRARWEIRRARELASGKVQAAQMKLTRCADGSHVASGKNNVVAAVTEHIGFGFKQFIGVVLLAQHSFSAFLKGNPEERADLLEQLVDNIQQYADIGQAAAIWHRERKRALEYKQEGMDLQKPLSTDARTELEEELAQVRTDQEKHNQQHQQTESLIQWFKDVEQATASVEAAIVSKHAAEQIQADAAPDYKRLAEHDKAGPCIAALKEKNIHSVAQLHSVKKCEASRNNIEELTKQQGLAEDEAQNICGSVRGVVQSLAHNLETLLPWKAADPVKIQQIENLAEKIQETEQLVRQQAQQVLTSQEAVNKSTVALAEADKHVKEKETITLDHRKLVSDKEASRTSWTQKHGSSAQVQTQIETCAQAFELLDRYAEQQSQRIVAQKNLISADKAKEEAEQAVQLAQKHMIDCETADIHAARMLEKAMALAAIAEHRHELHVGEACPLCEQTVTTLPQTDAANILHDLRKDRTEVGERLVRARTQHQQTEKARATAQQTSALQQQTSITVETQMHALSRVWEKLREHLSILPTELLVGEELMKTIEAAQEQGQKAQAQLKDLETELLKAQEEWRASEITLQKCLANRVVVSERLQLEGKNVDAAQRDKEAAEILVKDLRVQHVQAVEPVRMMLPASTRALPEQECLQLACKKHAEWDQAKVLADLYTARFDELDASLSAILPAGLEITPQVRNGVSEEDCEICMKNGRRTYKELERLRIKKAEEETVLVHEQQTANSLEKSVQVAEQTCQQEFARAGFADEEALTQVMLSEKEETLLRERLKTIDQNVHTSAVRLLEQQQVSKQLSETPPAHLPAKTNREKLTKLLEQQEKSLAKLRDVAAALMNRLQEDDLRVKNQALASEELLALRADLERAERLHVLIGVNEGKSFRHFVCGLVLEELVGAANYQLQLFAPRYQLGIRESVDLHIIDLHMAGAERPVATLSGGESFLVSLALALALADLKRGRSAIETIFIDEGFGSLDKTSLDEAIAALERIQAERNATIVVVSHVGELHKRWNNGIHVNKLSGGHSWIVTPNGPIQPPKGHTLTKETQNLQYRAAMLQVLKDGTERTVSDIILQSGISAEHEGRCADILKALAKKDILSQAGRGKTTRYLLPVMAE